MTGCGVWRIQFDVSKREEAYHDVNTMPVAVYWDVWRMWVSECTVLEVKEVELRPREYSNFCAQARGHQTRLNWKRHSIAIIAVCFSVLIPLASIQEL